MTRTTTIEQVLSTISFEEASDEVETKIATLSEQDLEKWSNMYFDMLNDKFSYKRVGIQRAYQGKEDGTIPILAQVRLKLLAYHILYGGKNNDETAN